MLRLTLLMLLASLSVTAVIADDSVSAKRRDETQIFQVRAQARTGVLVPLYVYPADIHKNPVYNRLIELKRQYETVPMWVILNAASGPGDKVDGNYTKAIDRLRGAGCVVIGYVATGYGKRTQEQVKSDIDLWLKLYPQIQGIFFDEMRYDDTAEGSKYQAALNKYAHEAGCWPTVGNPGADTPGRYFAESGADVIIVHEGDAWPKEDRLKGDYFGGYSDYPPHTRGVLLYTQEKLDKAALKMVRKYTRWVYVTEAPFRANDPKATNPWDRLSKHLDELCEELSGK